MIKKLLIGFAALGLVASTVGVAAGSQQQKKSRAAVREITSDTDSSLNAIPPDDDGGHQHGQADEHLPGARRNVKLLSKLELTETPGGIADVHFYKDYAYLAAWAPECPSEGGSGAGVHVVDVSDPRNPVKVGFISSGAHDYVGEGVHAIHVDTEFFTGDILLVNHEACDLEGMEGISLWDITNPTTPVPLAQHVGDFDIFGEPFANSVHSVMGFTQDNKSRAYAVLVDNYEAGSTDVDIMDITNPVAPVLINETGLPDWPAAENDGHGENAFHHDMWFKRIDGIDVLAVSYWDAGWVYLNVNDPANPTFMHDTNYPANDLLGFDPEGNAHQGEWNHNSRLFLGTDEDFAPFRSKFDILTGPNAGEYPGAEFGWTVPIAINFTGDKAEGTTVWGGTGCPGTDANGNGVEDRSEVPAASAYDAQYSEGEERILILTRGICFFSEKVESAQMKGWDMVIIGNHHSGSGHGAFPDAYLCGSKGHEFEVTISGGCTGHRAMHLVLKDEPAYAATEDPNNFGNDLPPIGTVGEDVRITSQFDGWGYLNLYTYDNEGGTDFRDFYADRHAIDRDHAFGSGTMSIHEIETDRRRGVNMGYVAWYAIGLKVVSFNRDSIRSEGVYRHNAGNDFWGVSLEHDGNERPLIYMSDRDHGLWIFKFTGCTQWDTCVVDRVDSTVTIDYGGEFGGSVYSANGKCVPNRLVKLYKLNSRTGGRRVVGRDRTGPSGNWRIPRDNPRGRFTAEVTRKVIGEERQLVCGGDRSPIIKVRRTDNE